MSNEQVNEMDVILAARRIVQDCMADVQEYLVGYHGGVGGPEWWLERREKAEHLLAVENRRAAGLHNGDAEAWA